MADAELLADLRPARWPDAAPLATADALALAVAIGLAAGLALALVIAASGRRRASPKRDALAAIVASAGAPAGERLARVAAALKAYALRRDPALATAEGAAYAAGLDRLFRTRFFTAGAGRVLVAGLYAPAAPAAAEAAAEGTAALIAKSRP